jgi:magnesium-transporting ATPase (P-type)
MIVFIGAVAGFGQPLTAVQMLWVNLVMDTMGALALGTEAPTRDLLDRRPYLRNASLISRPMWRNISVQSAFQLTLLLVLLFKGAGMFRINYGVSCFRYTTQGDGHSWDVGSSKIQCSDFNAYCAGDKSYDCFARGHNTYYDGTSFAFKELSGFELDCLKCAKIDYRHGTIIFNAFIFCQVRTISTILL